jgi:uncharacterized protein (TIGR02646 family)
MIELQHRAQPPQALLDFLRDHPDAQVADFNALHFRPAKHACRQALHEDQGGLCVYCERPLAADEGQIEHIKPKAGRNAHPQLCFDYRNYAHGCTREATCGQRKGNGLLPIEPGPGCNEQWVLQLDGRMEPCLSLTRSQKHVVKQTRDMLGLNADTALVDDRREWLQQLLQILQQFPQEPDIAADFLQDAPYRHILATVLR